MLSCWLSILLLILVTHFLIHCFAFKCMTCFHFLNGFISFAYILSLNVAFYCWFVTMWSTLSYLVYEMSYIIKDALPLQFWGVDFHKSLFVVQNVRHPFVYQKLQETGTGQKNQNQNNRNYSLCWSLAQYAMKMSRFFQLCSNFCILFHFPKCVTSGVLKFWDSACTEVLGDLIADCKRENMIFMLQTFPCFDWCHDSHKPNSAASKRKDLTDDWLFFFFKYGIIFYLDILLSGAIKGLCWEPQTPTPREQYL